MRFVNDGSNVAPSYQVAVQYAGLQTNSLAQVTLGFVNKPPYLAGGLPNQMAAMDNYLLYPSVPAYLQIYKAIH